MFLLKRSPRLPFRAQAEDGVSCGGRQAVAMMQRRGVTLDGAVTEGVEKMPLS